MAVIKEKTADVGMGHQDIVETWPQPPIALQWYPIQCKCRVRLWRWRSVYVHYDRDRFSVCI